MVSSGRLAQRNLGNCPGNAPLAPRVRLLFGSSELHIHRRDPLRGGRRGPHDDRLGGRSPSFVFSCLLKFYPFHNTILG